MVPLLRVAGVSKEDFVALVVEALAVALMTHRLGGTVGPITLWANG
jgi:hypothetical protein